MPLLNEGVECWRPTLAEDLGEGRYRVLATENYDPEYETWAFPPGSVVRCRTKTEGEEELLIASWLADCDEPVPEEHAWITTAVPCKAPTRRRPPRVRWGRIVILFLAMIVLAIVIILGMRPR